MHRLQDEDTITHPWSELLNNSGKAREADIIVFKQDFATIFVNMQVTA